MLNFEAGKRARIILPTSFLVSSLALFVGSHTENPADAISTKPSTPYVHEISAPNPSVISSGTEVTLQNLKLAGSESVESLAQSVTSLLGNNSLFQQLSSKPLVEEAAAHLKTDFSLTSATNVTPPLATAEKTSAPFQNGTVIQILDDVAPHSTAIANAAPFQVAGPAGSDLVFASAITTYAGPADPEDQLDVGVQDFRH